MSSPAKRALDLFLVFALLAPLLLVTAPAAEADGPGALTHIVWGRPPYSPDFGGEDAERVLGRTYVSPPTWQAGDRIRVTTVLDYPGTSTVMTMCNTDIDGNPVPCYAFYGTTAIGIWGPPGGAEILAAGPTSGGNITHWLRPPRLDQNNRRQSDWACGITGEHETNTLCSTGQEFWIELEATLSSADYRGGAPLPFYPTIRVRDPAGELPSGAQNGENVFGQQDPDELEVSCEVVGQSGPGGSIIEFEASVQTGDGSSPGVNWEFSDGTTATATRVVRTAEEPGDFVGTVTAVLGENTESATCVAEVDAPELGLAFSYPGREGLADGSPNMSFGLEDEVVVRVHVKATGGVGPLTDVEFVGDMLRSAPTTAWELEPLDDGGDPGGEGDDEGNEGDGDDGGLTLEPGDEATFDVLATALEPGGFSFLSTAVALDAADRMVGPVELERGGRIGELDVEVVVEPSLVELEEDEENENGGPVPEPVTVSVTVTNPFDVEISDVVVEVNDPQLVAVTVPPLGYKAFSYLVENAEDPDGELIQGSPDEIELGELGPGESVTHEFEGLALNRGEVVLRALARASYEGRLVAGVGDGELQVATDVLFVFDADIDPTSHWVQGGEPWVDGGDEWRIDGTFENRTHDETFEVVLLPMRERNAGLGIPRELLDPAIEDPGCVVGISKLVEPGETIEWSAPVSTSPTGATRSQVSYAPQVFVVNEDGTRAPLATENVLVTSGSDEHLMRVDTRDHPPVQPGAGELVWTFSESALETFEESFIGLLAAGAEMLELGLQPWEWPAAYQAGSDRMVEYLDTIYQNLSPADQALWRESLVATVVLATGMAMNDANALVNTMVLESFTELNEAWVQGDWQTTSAWMGRQVGANPDVALGALVKMAGACKLLSRNSPWARNALAAKEAQIADELAALGDNVTAANIPTGAMVTRDLRRRIWGIDDAMHAKVQAFVDEFKITIGVRRRGPGSIAKIEAGTHNPKPFHNKGKNTSALDRDYLSFIDDLDTAAIKQPPPVSELRQALASAPPDVRASVLARHRTRNKEWYGKAPSEPGTPAYEAWLENGTGANFTSSERYKWAQFAVPIERGGGIPVPRSGAPLDYRTNVSAGRSVPSDDVLYQRAPARIRTEVAPDGRPQMVLETDRGGGFKPDTGDMDPLVVTKADLSALPEAKRIAFYQRAHELGFEHVESASWNNPAGRNQYLMEHAIAGPGRPQGEAMFQWMANSGPRATRFDPQRSWHDPSDELNAARFFLHGTDVYLKVPDPGVSSSYTIDDSDDYRGYISPKSTVIVDPECQGIETPVEPGEGSCSVVFDRGSDAIVFRQDDEGDLQEWTADDGWDTHEIDSPGDLHVLPQSVLTDGAEAGEERLEIASANELDLEPGVDDWFAVGDLVVVDPGGENEEFVTIAGFGSLILADPLHHDHAPGTLVSVVSPLGDPADPRDPNGPWPAGTGDDSDGDGGDDGGTGGDGADDEADDGQTGDGSSGEDEGSGGSGGTGGSGSGGSGTGDSGGQAGEGSGGSDVGSYDAGGRAAEVKDDAILATGEIRPVAAGSAGPLPRTGSNSNALAALGLIVLLIGICLQRAARRRPDTG